MPTVNGPLTEDTTPSLQSQLFLTNAHLGNVLYMFSDLDDDDRCVAFDEALEFYNKTNPTLQIQPIDGFVTHLIHETPLSSLIKEHKLDE